MGPQLELGRAVPVHSTIETPTTGLQISAVGEKYVPRDLNPDSTTEHEAIHAGLGAEGEVEHVTIIPGPGYNGLTRFRRPNALAAMGPHAMGARGTSWDVRVAHHIGGADESAARAAVAAKHSEIVEISDELGKKKVLTGNEVDAARTRARMKEKYGQYATVSALADNGERVTARVKVDGDKAAMPKEIVDFSAKVKARQLEEQAQKALKLEKKKANPEITGSPVTAKEPEASEQLPRGREVVAPINTDASNKPEAKTPENAENTAETGKPAEQNNAVQTAEEILRAEFAKIQEEQRLADVRAELAQLEEVGTQREYALAG